MQLPKRKFNEQKFPDNWTDKHFFVFVVQLFCYNCFEMKIAEQIFDQCAQAQMTILRLSFEERRWSCGFWETVRKSRSRKDRRRKKTEKERKKQWNAELWQNRLAILLLRCWFFFANFLSIVTQYISCQIYFSIPFCFDQFFFSLFAVLQVFSSIVCHACGSNETKQNFFVYSMLIAMCVSKIAKLPMHRKSYGTYSRIDFTSKSLYGIQESLNYKSHTNSACFPLPHCIRFKIDTFMPIIQVMHAEAVEFQMSDLFCRLTIDTIVRSCWASFFLRI